MTDTSNKASSINRRNLLQKSAAGTVATMFGSAFFSKFALAESTKQEPIVWMDMSQKELDNAYTQSVYAQNAAQVIGRWATNSELNRNYIGDPLRLAYGDKAIEAMDVYQTKQSNAPVNIFIHGGAWRSSAADIHGFPAESFIRAGAHFVLPDFSWVQDEENSLFPLVDQLRRAVAWIYRNAASFGGDPHRIYLSGHSSGGHLAGVILITDWEKDFGLPKNIIKGALCCSGMFDLKPVRLSYRGNYIKFTDEMEQALSPIRHVNKINTPVIVAYGTYETPEFKRQSEDFALALKTAGKSVELLVADGYNHFEIYETLANPYGILGRAVLKQMHL